MVALDFHPSAAAKALLSPPEFVVEEGLIDGQSGWQAGNKGYQRLPMGLSGGEVAKHEL
jgi:hypothetical protein